MRPQGDQRFVFQSGELVTLWLCGPISVIGIVIDRTFDSFTDEYSVEWFNGLRNRFRQGWYACELVPTDALRAGTWASMCKHDPRQSVCMHCCDFRGYD